MLWRVSLDCDFRFFDVSLKTHKNTLTTTTTHPAVTTQASASMTKGFWTTSVLTSTSTSRWTGQMTCQLTASRPISRPNTPPLSTAKAPMVTVSKTLAMATFLESPLNKCSSGLQPLLILGRPVSNEVTATKLLLLLISPPSLPMPLHIRSTQTILVDFQTLVSLGILECRLLAARRRSLPAQLLNVRLDELMELDTQGIPFTFLTKTGPIDPEGNVSESERVRE